MIRLRSSGLVLALLAMALVGCDSDGVTRPPPTSIVVVNAAPSYEELFFMREERDSISGDVGLPFGQGVADSFDSGPYDFNVDFVDVSNATTRIGTISTTLAPDSRYLFVLVEGGGGGVTPLLVELPSDAPSGSNAQTAVIHGLPGGGTYDAYVEAAGTDLLTATPIGTLGYGQNIAPVSRPEGNYRLYLTTPGDATDVRFESVSFVLPANSSSFMVIKDEGGGGTTPIDIVFFGNAAITFPDVNSPSALRVINGIADRTARDMTLDAAYTPPLFPAVAYGAVTDFVEVAPGAHELNVTPVGNPVDELTAPADLSIGRRHTVMVSGDTSNGLTRVIVTDDMRPRAGEGSVRAMNGAELLGPIGFFLLAPGRSITEVQPFTLLDSPGISPRFSVPPGDYELTLQALDTLAVVAGPTAVTIEAGGVYEVLAFDAVGGSTADVLYLGDFN